MASAARSTLIVLAILVAALVALFVASLVCSPDERGPGSGCAPAERDAWRARLLRAEPVGAGQLAGCAAAPGRFPIVGRCELRIAPADARSRRLVVEAVDPIELRLVVDADGRPVPMRVDLDPGEREEIFVGKGGQALTLRCRAGVTCRAAIE